MLQILKEIYNSFALGLGLLFRQFSADLTANIATPKRLIVVLLNVIFSFLFICSAISLLLVFYIGIKHIWSTQYCNESEDQVEIVIRAIELLFISPLPLIIVSAFHGYYEKIIKPNLFREPNDHLAFNENRNKSLVDFGIIKYLFVSILISTILVVILQIVLELKPQKQTTCENTNSRFQPATDLTKSGVSSSSIQFPISKEQIHRPTSIGLSDFLDNYSATLGVSLLLLIFLLIYFQFIGKNLHNDISRKSVETNDQNIIKGLEERIKELESKSGND